MLVALRLIFDCHSIGLLRKKMFNNESRPFIPEVVRLEYIDGSILPLDLWHTASVTKFEVLTTICEFASFWIMVN